MFVALNTQGQLVTMIHQKSTTIQQFRSQKWFCPQCEQPVFLRAGATCVPHFVHYRRSACQLAHETMTHLAGKTFLYNYFEQRGYQCQLEYFLPTIQQRPDLLLIRGDQQLAVEYQCSPLSLHQLQRRTAGYHCQGLPVIWILGPGYYTSKLQNRQLRFVNQKKGLGYYLLFLLPDPMRFLLLHHLQQQGLPIKHRYYLSTLNHTTGSKLIHPRSLDLAQQLTYIQRQIHQGNKCWYQLQQACYQQHHHVLMAPLWCHQVVSTIPVLKQSTFILRVYFLLTFEQQPLIKPQALTCFRQQHQFLFRLTGYQLQQQQVTLLTTLISSLVAQDYLIVVAQGWYWHQLPPWFTSYQQKLNISKKTSK